MAMSCCVSPTGTEELAGVTAMETSIGGTTVSLVDPLMAPEDAVIVVLPCGARAVANPLEFMDANNGLEEVQVKLLLRT